MLPSYMSLIDAVMFEDWGFTKQGFMFHLCPTTKNAERALWTPLKGRGMLDHPIVCTACVKQMPVKTYILLSRKNKILWTGMKTKKR